MKKVLLALLALSATLMAESTGVENSGEASVQITTRAFIVDSGLIITETPTESRPISSIELNHGTIIRANKAASDQTKDIYIKKSNHNSFIANTTLEIALSGDSELKNTAGGDPILHTLTAIVGSEETKKTLVLTKENSSVTDNFITNGSEKDNAIKVSLISHIGENAINNGMLEGSYSNTSTLSVKFSKTPQVEITSR